MRLWLYFMSVCLVESVSRYCIDCKRRHYSDIWHEQGAGYFCDSVYTSLVRDLDPGEPLLPSYRFLIQNLNALDQTGSRIVALKYRRDILAGVNVRAECMADYHGKGWSATRYIVLALFFAWTMYWELSMHDLVKSMLPHSPSSLNESMLSDLGEEIVLYYQVLRYQSGALVFGHEGLSPTKNPSERRSGMTRYHRLCQDYGNGILLPVCDRIVEILEASEIISISKLRSIILRGELSSYPITSNYSLVRFCRALVYIFDKVSADSTKDWSVLSSMSPSIKVALSNAGIGSHSDAIAWRDALGTRLGITRYSLGDLVCFFCLSENCD